MKTQRLIATCLAGLFLSGCVKRVPVYDEAGERITEQEIEAHRTNKNTAFYAVAGGALSFGVSFFAGTMIARAADKSQNSPELWATTGAGTLVGTILFARHGVSRDRNSAIEAVRDLREKEAQRQLTTEKDKQDEVSKKLEDLKSIRAKQEAEKAKLEEELKKKKKKKKKGKNGHN